MIEWRPETFILLMMAPFIGSFLGVLVIRLPKNEDVVSHRSHCRSCSKSLSAIDLIPDPVLGRVVGQMPPLWRRAQYDLPRHRVLKHWHCDLGDEHCGAGTRSTHRSLGLGLADAWLHGLKRLLSI